jgi:hypothetical protein
MSRFHICLLSVILLTNCRTVSPSESAHIKNTKYDNGIKESCPLKTVMCAQNYDPAFCYVTEYDQQPIKDKYSLKYWGSNNCDSTRGLYEKVCKLNLSLQKIGKVICIPDATNGHCPVKKKCKDNVQKQAYTCQPKKYGSQHIKNVDKFISRGASECQARNRLNSAACSENLDPSLLGDVECKPDLFKINLKK